MTEGEIGGTSWTGRLWSRNAAVLLGRNTVVSTAVFLLGLLLLWLLVEFAHVEKVTAAGVTFLIANTLHYGLGRAWIYRGTTRGVAPGYALFIANSCVGFVVTIVMFDALVRYTPINYLIARIIVSVFAGLAMFLLNAILNFRRL
jgi:putative flippase GtrA